MLQDTVTVLRQKFSDGVPSVYSLSDEQKAWLQMKIQSLADDVTPSQAISQLQKIGIRLTHATEDVPDEEMQRIISFVFENMTEIESAIKKY